MRRKPPMTADAVSWNCLLHLYLAEADLSAASAVRTTSPQQTSSRFQAASTACVLHVYNALLSTASRCLRARFALSRLQITQEWSPRRSQCGLQSLLTAASRAIARGSLSVAMGAMLDITSHVPGSRKVLNRKYGFAVGARTRKPSRASLP
jgi:hypothetical protein